MNDGVTIAKEIELEDAMENMGAQLIKEVATKTNDIAGDGTTTATVLAQKLIREGMKNVTAGASPWLSAGVLQRLSNKAVEELAAISQKVSGTEDIRRVGTISADDEVIGTRLPTPWKKCLPTALSPLKSPSLPIPTAKSSRVCSLTAAISLLYGNR